MNKLIILLTLIISGNSVFAQNVVLIANESSGRYVSESGSQLAAGSLVRYGELNISSYNALSDSQKMDYNSVNPLFTEHGASNIDSSGDLSYFDSSYSGPSGVKLYTWVFNAAIASEASEWGLFTGGTSWNSPAGIGTSTLSTSSEGFSAVYGTATAAGLANNLQAVPEPTTYAMFAGLAVFAMVAIRRRRAALC